MCAKMDLEKNNIKGFVKEGNILSGTLKVLNPTYILSKTGTYNNVVNDILIDIST